jgi:hypothetical protein
VAYQLTSYADHDTDAKGATPTYHNVQYAGSDLVSEVAPTTLAEALVDLIDLQTKYNAHDADTDAHTTGSTHQETHTLYEYATVSTDYIVEVSDTEVAPTIVLSSADCADGRIIIVKDTSGNAGVNGITVSTENVETIDGAATYVIGADYNSVTLVSNGSHWFVI